MMPQMDGWLVLTALKPGLDVSGIPVVMASFVYELAMANALGAADYVQKPVEWDHLKFVMDRFRASGGSVLVVDAAAGARRRLRTVLEKQHWIVAKAANGEEALKSVEAAPPQLILLDLTMPVMDGFTFLHELRARPGGAEIPVVVLSARDRSKGIASAWTARTAFWVRATWICGICRANSPGYGARSLEVQVVGGSSSPERHPPAGRPGLWQGRLAARISRATFGP